MVLNSNKKILALFALFVVLFMCTILLPPIPVSEEYHQFADSRSCLGIPNFGDVISNMFFLMFGVMGLVTVAGKSGKKLFLEKYHSWPYLSFFCVVVVISFGSTYYHLNPSNERLYLDRAPILIGFLCLFAAFTADRVDQRGTIFVFFPFLLAIGVGALFWDLRQMSTGGDLRFYGLLQVYTFITLPLVCWLFPNCRYTSNYHMYLILGWYALAKFCELYDKLIFESLAGLISGHTVKHAVASLAICTVIIMLRKHNVRS